MPHAGPELHRYFNRRAKRPLSREGLRQRRAERNEDGSFEPTGTRQVRQTRLPPRACSTRPDELAASKRRLGDATPGELGFDLGGMTQHSGATSLHVQASFPESR